MVFPSDPLGTVVQLKINGTWTNVVRYDTNTKIMNDSKVLISRGAGGLKTQTPSGSCQWTWSDPNGIYDNENPRSPYFGLLNRNTPVRVYVPRSTAALYILNNDDGGRGQTTDKAALDITGDIEIRFDIEPRRFTRWGSGASRAMIIASKYGASGNRSWYIRIGDSGGGSALNRMAFTWSTTGSNSISATCTAPLPTTGRISVKITLDVDNGAGGSDTKFYTASSIDGTYTQLGSTVTLATTSIFSSSANVEIGTMNGGALDGTFSSSVENYYGRVYGFRIYNGIGGSLVANADYASQTTGTTSFADGLGNTWTLGGNAEITNADYRYHGELSDPRKVVNKTASGTGIDVRVNVDSGGIIRRLTSNDQPLKSPLRYILGTYAANGWWPGEDSTDADTSSASSGLTGVLPADLTDITFAGYDSTLGGSAGVMLLGSTGPTFVGACKAATATNETHFIGFFKFPSVPASEQVLFRLYSTDGTIVKWEFSVSNINYTLYGYNAAGTLVVTKQTTFGTGASPTDWIAYHMQLTNSAGTISIKSEWMSITSGAVWTANAAGTLSYAGSNGTISKVVVQGVTALADVRIAHLLATTQVGLQFYDGSNNTFAKWAAAFPGETADQRIKRICGLLGVTCVIIGKESDSEQMGVQPIASGMNIIYQCVDVDGGILTEANDQLALEYRTRKSLYNQAGMTLTWAQLSDRLEKTPDDTDIANDILMTRDNGGSARATLEYGSMSIQAPPNGINTVPDGPNVNNYEDARLPYLVQFDLLKRTWPTSRYPNVKIGLHRSPFTSSTSLQLAAMKTEISDMITINSLPSMMDPYPLYLLIKGINETLQNKLWDIDFVAVPYGPYISSETNATTGDFYTFKACHDTQLGVVQTQVNTDFNSSAISISVKTISGPLLSTAITSMNIRTSRGERMTVTNVSGTTSPQTLTVTRGVDGFSTAHFVGDYIYVDLTLKARL